MLTHGELFAGIGGFGLGFDRAGMKTIWHVEVDKCCQNILRRHNPESLILGDIRECGANNLPYVDVISFGSPCQDLSIAGKRKGIIDGERSNLFFEAIRIVEELKPAFAVWENVPGAFSSNHGRDFAAVLNAFHELGTCDVAWRCLDAQYFGVPQRRRRIFLMADFRGERAAEILFESQIMSWDPPPRRKAGQGVAATIRGRSKGNSHEPGRGGEDDYNLIGAFSAGQSSGAYGIAFNENVAPPIRSGESGDNRVPTIAHALSASNTATGRPDPNGQDFVVAHETGKGFWTEGLPGLRSQPGGMPENIVVTGTMIGVRRLTPTECSRLQGFSDDWNEWGVDESGNRVEQSDSARYRQLGNAVAVPVVEWIGKRIVRADAGLNNP